MKDYFTRSSATLLAAAGAAWVLAGIIYVSSEAIAAAYYPGYSYVTNYISDLGVPYYGVYNGRVQDSQLAEVMNIGGFIINGIVFSLAALLLFLSKKSNSTALLLILALTHTAGNILVGTIHGGPAEAASGTGVFHLIGALMAIIGGNLVVITASKISSQFSSPKSYQYACYALGTMGLVSLSLLGLNTSLEGSMVVPDGVYERLAVYTITMWEFMTGAYIFLELRRNKRYGTLERAFNR